MTTLNPTQSTPSTTESPAIRTAVVGVGYLGTFHAAKLAELPGAELVAVVDCDQAARERVAGDLGVPALSDYRELIGKVDAVSVVVPTTGHYSIARDCLEHDIHVLVEKPITETVSQADGLIRRAAERNLVLQVGHLERFNPAIRSLEPLVEFPRFIESIRIAPFKERGVEVDVVLDLMVHDIDIIQSLVPSPIERIDANGTPVISDKPDIANARIQFEDGCVAVVTSSRVSFKTERKIRIFQPSAYFSADLHKKTLSVHRKRERDGSDRAQVLVNNHVCDEQDALRLEIAAFIEAVRMRSQPVVTGEAGKLALETAMEVVAQIEKNAMRDAQVAQALSRR